MEKSLAEMNMAVQLNPIKNRHRPVHRDNQRVKDIIYLDYVPIHVYLIESVFTFRQDMFFLFMKVPQHQKELCL